MRLFALAFALSGCALVSGLSDVKVSGDGGPIIGTDASTEAASSGCPQACGAVPDGWWALAKPKDASSACTDRVVVDWTSGVDMTTACPCGCAVATQPACTGGDLKISYADQCFNTNTISSAGCVAGAGTISNSYRIAPLSPSGGTCGTPSSSPNPASKITLRTCAMPQGCAGAPCLGANETACIVKVGAATCPSDFPIATSVGTDATVACMCSGACSLQVTCDNAALHFYTDGQCAMELAQAVADNKCDANGAVGKTYNSARYLATVNAACHGTGAGTAKVDLVGISTMCCKQ